MARTDLPDSVENPEWRIQGLLRYLYVHPTYAEPLRAMLAWAASRRIPFRWYDVRVLPRDLQRLALDGILTRDANGYVLADPQAAAAAYSRYREEVRKIVAARENVRSSSSLPLPPGVPKDLFEDIIGYDDVKAQLSMALRARQPVHVLLYGPPATAKSLFIESLKVLPGAVLTFGDEISKAGLRRFVLEERPRYLILDEIEKMASEDDTILLELLEHQTVSVVHHDQRWMETIDMRVFGAANDLRKMRRELLSRFHKVRLREYTPDEFRYVAYNYLTKRGNPPAVARSIADGVSERSRDIRDAIRIAAMSQSVQDASFLISRLGLEANV